MATETIDLSTVPLQPPPPGVEPNFINPPSQGNVVIITTILILLLSAVFVGLRCYTRLILIRKFGSSDYLFLFGYILTITNGAFLIAAIKGGLGKKPWNIPLRMFFPYLALNLFIQRITYALSLVVLKVAILLFYPQLNPSKRFQILVHTLIGLVIALSFSGLLLNFFLCSPVSAAWDFEVASQHPCKDFRPFIIYSGTVNISTDFMILVLPIAMLWEVRMAKKKKIAVALLLASGSLASLISILRVVASFQASAQHDSTYLKVAIWSNAEINAALICVCLPTLKPFIRSSFPTLWPTSAKRSQTPHSAPIILSAQRRATPAPQLDKNIMGSLSPFELQEQMRFKNTSSEYILGDAQHMSQTDATPLSPPSERAEHAMFRPPV